MPADHIPAQTAFISILPVSNPLKEFHMGIRMTTSTWRQPLRLIDSWLPSPQESIVTPRRGVPQLLQRFAKAGWLKIGSRSSPHVGRGPCEPTLTTVPLRTCRVRVAQISAPGARSGARLVISGRMADVCAELERLEALESQDTAVLV